MSTMIIYIDYRQGRQLTEKGYVFGVLIVISDYNSGLKLSYIKSLVKIVVSHIIHPLCFLSMDN